jgi:tRNA A-37 threonylcarbamoyl transferase component Bud32
MTMLSIADTNLVRRDTALPGLATLLDPEELTARLQRNLARADFEIGPVLYVKYQPGKNCLAGYELRTGSRVIPVHATAHRYDALRKLEKARRDPGSPSCLGPGKIAIDDCVIVASLFPNDRKILCLSLLADDESRERFLANLIPGGTVPCRGNLHPIVYKPQLRYVACVVSDGKPRAVLKSYSDRDYGAARDHTRVFGSRDDLRLPKLLGSADAHAALALEWLPGRLLSDSLSSSPQDVTIVRRVGRALALLHIQETASLPIVSPRAAAGVLADIAENIGVLCPGLAERGQLLAVKLGAALCALRPTIGPIHGDFYARQVLVSAENISILDLDAAACGHPAMDLGNFIAYLEREALRTNRSASQITGYADALIAGYHECAPPVRADSVYLYTAVGLFRMGLKPFRNR